VLYFQIYHLLVLFSICLKPIMVILFLFSTLYVQINKHTITYCNKSATFFYLCRPLIIDFADCRYMQLWCHTPWLVISLLQLFLILAASITYQLLGYLQGIQHFLTRFLACYYYYIIIQSKFSACFPHILQYLPRIVVFAQQSDRENKQTSTYDENEQYFEFKENLYWHWSVTLYIYK
jgi:hypothetical protein